MASFKSGSTPTVRQLDEMHRFYRVERSNNTLSGMDEKTAEQMARVNAAEMAANAQSERDGELEELADRFMRVKEMLGDVDDVVAMKLLEIEQRHLDMKELIRVVRYINE